VNINAKVFLCVIVLFVVLLPVESRISIQQVLPTYRFYLSYIIITEDIRAELHQSDKLNFF